MWNNALTLYERAALSKGSAAKSKDSSALLKRWTSQPPFTQQPIFAKRLRAAGLSQADFKAALSLDVDRSDPPSTGNLCYEKISSAWDARLDAQLVLSHITPYRAEGIEAFAHLAGPLISDAYSRVLSLCQTLDTGLIADPEKFARRATTFVAGTVARIAQRCLLRELHDARKDGVLIGTTPEARYDHFCERIATKDVSLDILARYPVLARQLTIAVFQWETAVCEMLQRLEADFELLNQLFGHGMPFGVLTDITLDAGDHHCDGRSVSILEFSSGIKLVYKPRSIAIDAAYADLVDWLRHEHFAIEMKAAQVLPRNGYGWCEYIAQRSCQNTAQASAFFERQGVLLLLFYVFSATDFHHENLIAAGEFPVPIDLETLLQPDTTLNGLTKGAAAPGNDVYSSVMTAGLLPSRLWSGKGKGIDLSGLAAKDQKSPIVTWALEDVGTDQMRMVKKQVAVPAGKHGATLNGIVLRPEDHIHDIQRGFRAAYRFFQAHKAGLLAADGPLKAFETVETRVILRATYYYALLLSDAFHPDLLTDALERDLYLDRLWIDAARRKPLAQAAEAERRDLWRNDIPRFSTHASETHLRTSDGEVVENFWALSPMAGLEAKIAAMCDSDLGRQAWLVEKTLRTLTADEAPQGYDRYQVTETASPDLSADALSAAKQVADQLVTLSFAAEDQSRTWVTCTPNAAAEWGYGEAGPDLYNGLAGMSLFFAYLHQATHDPQYDAAARGAWQSVQRIIGSPYRAPFGLGAFTGWGGFLYVAQHLGALWQDDEPLLEMLAKIPAATQLVANDKEYDIVGGSAGFIAAALNLVDAGYAHALPLAVAAGDHLLGTASETGTGLGWHLEIAGAEPLGGFSHGTAGIAWALMRLAAASGDQRYHTAALQALAYDRSLYRPDEGNWLDVREGGRPGETEAADSHFVTAWCHGAPGIGLSRLLMKPYCWDALAIEECVVAVRKTLADGFGKNHSLCHGDLGNYELLRRVAEATGDEQLLRRCQRIAGGIITSGKSTGWRGGYPPNTEPLGLMVGLAGIGLGLLKLAHWDKVPSVLALEPPLTPGARTPATSPHQAATHSAI